MGLFSKSPIDKAISDINNIKRQIGLLLEFFNKVKKNYEDFNKKPYLFKKNEIYNPKNPVIMSIWDNGKWIINNLSYLHAYLYDLKNQLVNNKLIIDTKKINELKNEINKILKINNKGEVTSDSFIIEIIGILIEIKKLVPGYKDWPNIGNVEFNEVNLRNFFISNDGFIDCVSKIYNFFSPGSITSTTGLNDLIRQKTITLDDKVAQDKINKENMQASLINKYVNEISSLLNNLEQNIKDNSSAQININFSKLCMSVFNLSYEVDNLEKIKKENAQSVMSEFKNKFKDKLNEINKNNYIKILKPRIEQDNALRPRLIRFKSLCKKIGVQA